MGRNRTIHVGLEALMVWGWWASLSMTKGLFWCKGIERFDALMKGLLLLAGATGIWNLHGTTINQALCTFGE